MSEQLGREAFVSTIFERVCDSEAINESAQLLNNAEPGFWDLLDGEKLEIKDTLRDDGSSARVVRLRHKSPVGEREDMFWVVGQSDEKARIDCFVGDLVDLEWYVENRDFDSIKSWETNRMHEVSNSYSPVKPAELVMYNKVMQQFARLSAQAK